MRCHLVTWASRSVDDEAEESMLCSSPVRRSQWCCCVYDNTFDHWASTLQRGSQNKEDNCKASAQEICGNKVSTCHGCEMLLRAFVAHSFCDNGLLRHIQLICLPFLAFVCTYHWAQTELMEIRIPTVGVWHFIWQCYITSYRWHFMVYS